MTPSTSDAADGIPTDESPETTLEVVTVLAAALVAGGLTGTAATVGQRSTAALSPVALLVGATVVGTLVGALVGWRFLSVTHAQTFVNEKRFVLMSAAGLFATMSLVFVTGLGSPGDLVPFWTGLGGVALTAVGWVALLQVGQTATAREAIHDSETVVTLHEDTALPGFERADGWSRRVRRKLEPLTGLAIVVLVVLAWVDRTPFLLLFALPGFGFMFPLSGGQTRLTDRGVVFQQRLPLVGAISTKLVSWEHFEGYRHEEETLVIEYGSVWRALEYDCARIDDVDGAVALVDRQLSDHSA